MNVPWLKDLFCSDHLVPSVLQCSVLQLSTSDFLSYGILMEVGCAGFFQEGGLRVYSRGLEGSTNQPYPSCLHFMDLLWPLGSKRVAMLATLSFAAQHLWRHLFWATAFWWKLDVLDFFMKWPLEYGVKTLRGQPTNLIQVVLISYTQYPIIRKGDQAPPVGFLISSPN